MKKIPIMAILLLCLVNVPSALSYFTTYVRAKGSLQLHLQEHTKIHEPDVVEWKKHVEIAVDKDSDPVFVRVRAFAPSEIEDDLQYLGEGWQLKEDGYAYYDKVLQAEETAAVDVFIAERPADPQEGDTFHVVVIYESVPALYDAQGNAYADWSQKGGGQ